MVVNTEILLRAWRERWTPLQWLVEVKKLAGMDNEELQDLAECLVQQATFGSTPSTLILSYLNHGIMTKVISCSSALTAVHQFQNIIKHKCLSALLDLLLSFVPTISRPDRDEECLKLAVSLVKIVYWLLIVVTRLLKLCLESMRLSGGANLPFHLSNAGKCNRAFGHLMGSSSYRAMVIVGKMEQQAMAFELDRQLQAHLKDLLMTQPEGIVPEVQLYMKELMVNFSRLQSLNSSSVSGDISPGHVPNMSVQIITQFQVLVSPSYTPNQVADVMEGIMNTQNVARHQLYLEFLRSAIVGLLDAPDKSMEAILWAGFLFLKVPMVIRLLETRSQPPFQLQPTPGEHSTAHNAFQQLLQFAPLLDDADLKCRCNCYKELIQQYYKDLNQQVADRFGQLISQRLLSTEVQNMLSSQYSFNHPAQQIQDEENKILEIIGALESDLSSRDEKFLNPLLNVEKFRWMTVAAASVGKLQNLIRGLVKVTDQTVHAATDKEDVKRGNVRGELFNTSFLLLCHIGQVYGRKVVLDVAKTRSPIPFVVQWISRHIPDIEKWRTFIPDTQHSPNQAAVNELLNQFFSNSAFPASQANWDEHCMNVSSALHHVLKAWQCDTKAVPPDQLQKLCELLKYEAPALAVCACSWSCGHIHTLTAEERKYPMRLVGFLLNPVNPKGMPQGFVDRCAMLLEVIKRMSSSVEGKDNTWENDNPISAGKPVSKTLGSLFTNVVRARQLSSRTLKQFRHLLTTGGNEWFIYSIIKEIIKFTRHEEILLAADLASSLLTFNAESLVPSLLQQVLPLIMNHADAETILEDPKGWAIARLMAHAVCLGMTIEQTRSKGDLSDDQNERPAKIKRLDSFTLYNSKSSSRVQQALVRLCEDFIATMKTTEVGPVSALLVSFLQQAVASIGTSIGPLSACLPEDLVKEILELSPSLQNTPDILLGLCNMRTTEGRLLCAKALCNSI
ncbi:Mediator of RNA polymerase II transcription subunit 24 [Desmophyllum pertusum]|uniref:Mediator of RNA polymerase II transcription subunit 24 n=1 Tax=Desmophyllum pertusum TaxID=174260 RepID=A0A9W9YDV4_9CNID|nr:Mediator of RNA polymerase II transcription subunit 24 [Desmophyllum pertusum]